MTVAVVGSLAAAGVSAYSSYEAGQQANALAKYNAAQQNAENANTLQISAAKSLAERDQNAKILASQEAGYAAQGVVTNSGSPLTVESKQAGYLERKALNTDYEGAIASRFGQSKVFTDQMEGSAAKQAGNLNAAGSILSGVGNAASAYYKLGPSKS